MNVRLDYVTNSSSSSFLVAKHKDCTKKDIIEALQPARKMLVDLLKEDCLDDIPDKLRQAIEEDNEQEMASIGIKELANRFYEFGFGEATLNLGDWEVSSGECSNETDEFLDYFLYSCGYLIKNNDLFKIR